MLSLSPPIRSSVCLFVSPLFFLVVSLEFFLVLKSFNSVSRKFKMFLKFKGVVKGSYMDVLRKFKGSLQKFQ